MRMRMGFMLGFGAGYVMGSKAGRERYEKIRQLASEMWDSPTMTPVREQVDQARSQIKGTMQNRRVPLDASGMDAPPTQEPWVAAAVEGDSRV